MPGDLNSGSAPSEKGWTTSEKIRDWLLLLTFIIAFIGLFVAIYQAYLSRETAVQQLRSRIALLRFELPEKEKLGSSPKPLGHIVFRNLGEIPATRVAFYIETGTIPRSQWNHPARIESAIQRILDSNKLPACKNLPLGTTNYVVHPSKDSSRYLQFRFRDKEVDEQVRQRNKFLMVVGCFVYETFGEKRFSRFCGYMDSTDDQSKPDDTPDFKTWYPALCRDGIGNNAN